MTEAIFCCLRFLNNLYSKSLTTQPPPTLLIIQPLSGARESLLLLQRKDPWLKLYFWVAKFTASAQLHFWVDYIEVWGWAAVKLGRFGSTRTKA